MDPYKVLGVSENATDEEIKAAYRELVKKYHPDQYKDNPLADLAEAKLKEINLAYDEIQKRRAGNKSSYSSYESGYQSSYQSSSGNNASVYGTIRAKINEGDLYRAEAMLNSISNRDAEWYYLYGALYRRKGWHNEATQCFAQAYRMNPGNPEYARAFNETARRAGYYTGSSASRRGGGLSDLCTTLCLADCCCECLGGDLIPGC